MADPVEKLLEAILARRSRRIRPRHAASRSRVTAPRPYQARPGKEGHVKRRLVGIAAALTLGVTPIVVGGAPALASVHVCTKYGNQWCLGASNLNAGTIITNSSPGRDIILQDQGFTHHGAEVYRLVFALDTSKCVGFSSNGLAEVRDCSGNSNFTNWENLRFTSDGTTEWVNNSFAFGNCVTPNDAGLELTSDNTFGDRLFCSGGTRAGDYLKFTPSPSP